MLETPATKNKDRNVYPELLEIILCLTKNPYYSYNEDYPLLELLKEYLLCIIPVLPTRNACGKEFLTIVIFIGNH